MSQDRLSEVRSKMTEALRLIREAVDVSIPMLQEQRDGVVAVWEDFLKGFFGYVRERSQATKQNLFSLISFGRIWNK